MRVHVVLRGSNIFKYIYMILMRMYVNYMSKSKKAPVEDFEEALRVNQIDSSTYIGAHPLRLPLAGARGVYGGHFCAQALLVAILSAPGYVPASFHSQFLAPGSSKIPMTYKVSNLDTDQTTACKKIMVTQNDERRFSCVVQLCKPSARVPEGSRNAPLPEVQVNPTDLHHKYSDPSELSAVHHTDYIRNAYSVEFTDMASSKHELAQPAALRWITVFGGIVSSAKQFKNPIFNLVGLADLSDSFMLTTLARVLHIPWNPTEGSEHYDDLQNGLDLLLISSNILHLLHYNCMSLDHHLYFHTDSFESFDICRDWLTFSYQFMHVGNNRSLVRGFFYDRDGRNVATVVQEGLTHFHDGIAQMAKL